MRRLRVHTPQPLAADRTVVLEPAAARHLVRVLRQREGAEVWLFNGEGMEWRGRIVRAVPPDYCEVSLLAPRLPSTESALGTLLIQAVSRGERMDWAVQKAVELGVSRIVPVITERTEVRLQPERAGKRQAHWQAVAVAACEQSGRTRPPEVTSIRTLDAMLPDLPADALRLLPHPQGGAPLNAVVAMPATVVLAVGPEGGFTQREVELMVQAGFRCCTLGPRVLRTETAAAVALALIQARWGDLG